MSIENEALHKLNELLERHQITIFTEQEAQALKQVAIAWQGFEALGRIGSVVKSVLTWVGWAIAAYLAFKAGAVEWIRSIVR